MKKLQYIPKFSEKDTVYFNEESALKQFMIHDIVFAIPKYDNSVLLIKETGNHDYLRYKVCYLNGDKYIAKDLTFRELIEGFHFVIIDPDEIIKLTK